MLPSSSLDANQKLRERNTKLESELSEAQGFLSVVEKIGEKEAKKIIGFAKDKYGSSLLVVKRRYQEHLDIEVYDRFFREYHIPCWIQGDIDVVSNDKITVVDFLVDKDVQNRGRGEIAMAYFIRECKSEGIKKITGSLSWKDKDDFNKLEHFYTKCGFEVRFNSDRTGGNIKMEL